jgi:hypothetical protein
MPRLEDATFAVAEYIDRGDQRLTPVVLFILFDNNGFRRGGLINKMVLPFARFTVLIERALIDLSPPSRRFISTTSWSVTPRLFAIKTT